MSPINLQDLYPVPDIDFTPIIQTALDRPPYHVIVPYGQHRIDGTIYIGANRMLELQHNATLIRRVPNTDPMVVLTGNFSYLHGNGCASLMSKYAAPKGFAHSGSPDLNPLKLRNINWSQVRNIVFEGAEPVGNQALDNVGLMFSSTQATALKSGSNYNSPDHANLTFRFLRVGLHVGEVCNLNIFSRLSFYKIREYAILSRGNTENTFNGMGVHLSHDIKSVIKLESCLYNIFYGAQGEPGGKGMWFDIDERCEDCQIHGHDNTSGGYRNAGKRTLITDHGQVIANPKQPNQQSFPLPVVTVPHNPQV